MCVLYCGLLVACPVAGPSEHLCRTCVSIVTRTVEQAVPSQGQWLLAVIPLVKEMYVKPSPSSCHRWYAVCRSVLRSSKPEEVLHFGLKIPNPTSNRKLRSRPLVSIKNLWYGLGGGRGRESRCLSFYFRMVSI